MISKNCTNTTSHLSENIPHFKLYFQQSQVCVIGDDHLSWEVHHAWVAAKEILSSRLHTKLVQCNLDLLWYYFGCMRPIVYCTFRKSYATHSGKLEMHTQDKQSATHYISRTQSTQLAHEDEIKELHGIIWELEMVIYFALSCR